MKELKPCPFCAWHAAMSPWHGGGPDKRMISCANEDCHVAPSVTGESPQEAADRWNERRTVPEDY